MDLAWLAKPETWIAFLTLTVLEIVLGIDNIVFISILAGKLPESQRAKARQLGLSLALITRILLLLSITWVMGLKAELFGVMGHGFSGRDLILLLGGLFLIYKAVKEIHGKLEGEEHAESGAKAATFSAVIAQILVLDIVFSLDSVITAVGMASQVAVMIAAVIVAVGFMLLFAGPLSDFVDKHPTVKMLALAFLVLIGVNLVAEGFGTHIEKGYTYFAMAFATGVEMLNLRLKKGSAPVKLRGPARP
ncbi:MAG: TerC family protein [Fimbriimonadaceae bacterium]|nr:TerC family protein [Fimbriimonadaceae bacterium]